MPHDHKSALALAIEERGRKYHAHEVQGFFGLGGDEIHKIDFRTPVKSDDDKSVIAAHAYAASKAKGDGEAAARDLDVLGDAKATEVLFRSCFEHLPEGAPTGTVRYPAFSGGPQWMRDHLTGDQIAVLFNLLQEVKQSESALRTKISGEDVEKLARVCWRSRDTDIPEAILADCDREFLTQAFVLLAIRLADAKDWAAEDRAAKETDETDDAD